MLNAVAHRLGGLPVEDGEVAYFASNGDAGAVKLAKGEVKRRIGFVRQQDFLVECLTGGLLLSEAETKADHGSARNSDLCMCFCDKEQVGIR